MIKAVTDVVSADKAVARSIFGSDDPVVVLKVMTDFIATHHAAPVRCSSFELSVGSVGVFDLADTSTVVVKASPVATTSMEHLRAARAITTQLRSSGVPAPLPLTPPTNVGGTVLMTDSFLSHTPATTRHDDVACRAMAEGLERITRLATPLPDAAGLWVGRGLGPPDRLWNGPHSVIFDFEAAAAESEWIDDIAQAARSDAEPVLATSPRVVGHVDFSAQNVRMNSDAEIVAIFDWDSLMVMPEVVLVGQTAVHFTYRHNSTDPYPSPREAAQFVKHYEAARGMKFTTDELRAVSAAGTYTLAYTARCEQSGPARNDPGGCRQILRDAGANFLSL